MEITHHIYRTATGSTSYVGKNAVQAELQLSSLTTKPITDRNKHGRKGSIVMMDYNEHGFNFCRLTALDARALYSTNKDSEGLRRFIKPIEICRTMDAGIAAAVECAAQQFIKREIVKSAFTGGQFGKNDRALWKIDGMGGAGNGTGKGPFDISYACIIHNPTVDADDRYPNASLWSTTHPVNGLIFQNDVNINAVHYDVAAIAAAAAQNRDTENENHKKQRIKI